MSRVSDRNPPADSLTAFSRALLELIAEGRLIQTVSEAVGDKWDVAKRCISQSNAFCRSI